MQNVVDEIVAALVERGAKPEQISREDIGHKLDLLMGYNVPVDSARRTIVNQFLRDLGLARRGGDANQLITVKDITHKGMFLSIKVKIVALFDDNHPAVYQAGICGDETGVVKFVVFQKNAGLPGLPLEENCVYLLTNVVSDEYEGRFSIKLNKNTAIRRLDEDIEVKERSVIMMGAVVDILGNSGIIRRCPICDKVIVKGLCPDDGKVDPKVDLRVKAILDDGMTAQTLILNAEQTEKVTGINMEKAISIAMNAFGDNSAVIDTMAKTLMGKYWRVSGPIVGDNLLVKEMVPVASLPLDANIVSEFRRELNVSV